jgi:hypothetical protein
MGKDKKGKTGKERYFSAISHLKPMPAPIFGDLNIKPAAHNALFVSCGRAPTEGLSSLMASVISRVEKKCVAAFSLPADSKRSSIARIYKPRSLLSFIIVLSDFLLHSLREGGIKIRILAMLTGKRRRLQLNASS